MELRLSLIAPAALLCACLLVAETLRTAAPIPSALGLVALGVVAATVATRPSLSAVLLGAVSAVAYAALRPVVPTLAGAAFIACVVGPRAIRAISTTGRVLVVALSSLGGAVGTYAIAATEHAGPERLLGALLVTGFLLALPLAVPADDPVGGALRWVAAHTRGVARAAALRGVALRRRLERALHRPSRAERRAIEAGFQRLLELGDAREGALAGGPTLERAMRAQLDTLTSCVRALDRRAAEHEGLDARIDPRLDTHREGAEIEVRVLAELDDRPPLH